MSNFVHLHTHSEYSILDGMSRVKEIVDKAVEYGHKAIAITDHGHMGNVPDFYPYAKKQGIKPIIGQEFYITEDASKKDKNEVRNHIILLALNRDGYKTLCKLSTAASENFYYKPRLDREILRSFSKEYKNIVMLSGCMFSQLSQAILVDDHKRARELVQYYNVVFPNFYLEFHKHGYKKHKDKNEREFSRNEEKINKVLWEFHETDNIPVVVTNDSHYINKEDQEAHETLLAIQTGATMDKPDRFKFTGSGYALLDSSDMEKRFPLKIWKASERSMKKIVDKVDISLPEFENKEHFIPTFGLDDPDKELRKLCMRGLKTRVSKDKRKEYLRQLNYQLGVIKDCGYADEFLIVNDYVEYARRIGVQVGGGRGSMVGVLVSYLMGITDIDPIRFDLSFERALNPERPSLPDFDIDFSDKDIVIKYLRDKYGHENTMQIGTYNRMHFRSLLRALLRVFGYDYRTSINLTKQLPDIVDIIAEKAPSNLDELVEQSEGDLEKLFKEDKRIVPLMIKFNGLVQSMGTHAGGLLMGDKNLALRELIPTARISSESELISQFDKKAVEKQLGFVKFDILGITTLEIIQLCMKLIGKDIFDKYPDNDLMDDGKVYNLINSGNLTYVFQLDGSANRIAIDSIGGLHGFEDIVITTSIARPGTSQFIPELARNRKNGVKSYVHEDLKPIMKTTYGVLLYQEQVMEIARKFAGFDMTQIDDIKEMIKGKDHALFAAMKPKFIKGCVESGYNKKQAAAIWKIVERASGYLYNRSHAVSYSVITYQTAYLKTYYPLEFFVACMNISKPNEDKIKRLVQEAASMSFEILPPDIYKSGIMASIEDKSVRLGLSQIKGIGVRTAHNIVEARQMNGRRAIKELPKRVMSIKVVKALKDAGAFGEKHTDLAVRRAALGFDLDNPVAAFASFISDHTREGMNDAVFGGIITQVRSFKTKRGDDMAFVSIEFNGTTKTLAFFSEQLNEWGNILEEGNVILVKAVKQRNYDSMIPQKIKVLKQQV